jgi:polyvinyl alcohol dehydrogenase (cytochrome)
MNDVTRSVYAGLTGVLLATSVAVAAVPSLLFVSEGNRLRRVDIDTIGGPGALADVLIERASGEEFGGGPPVAHFRDINGMICRVPDGSGRFIAGEDTGQPNPPAGWGVFDPDGTQVGKLTATYLVAPPNGQPEPFGCAFDPVTRNLFTTEVGEQGFGTPNGQLIMWFPPYDRFPGPPGAYPATNDASTSFCKIATDLGTAGGIAVDAQGRVYVASASLLRIERFSPPFPTAPNAAGGCGATDPVGSPMADTVNREVLVFGPGITAFTGLAIARNGNLLAANIVAGEIVEYDLDGNLVRKLVDPPTAVPPHATGTPQGLAVDAAGTVYYADLDLVGTFPSLGPGPNGKVWRIPFDALGDPLPPEIVSQGLAFPDGVGVLPGDLEPREWRTYAGGPERRFFNAAETAIKAGNVDQLVTKWSFTTGGAITASPTVARVEVAGEGRIPVAYFLSWDRNVYAVRVRDGSERWRVATDVQPAATFPTVASVHVETLGGQDRVFVGSGEIMYALDAATGAELWRFVAGTGCGAFGGPDLCASMDERNEIESSAIVVDGKVVFGMDVDDRPSGKGGLYALDAQDGRLVWFFDLESGQTCRPAPGEEIRRYDGYHSESALGLPAGFNARPGCDFDRTATGCGNVWSSPTVDLGRGAIFVASSNCDTDADPGTSVPPPPMPPYDEAVFALDFDGNPLWRWRPREIDNADLAFGGVPNLMTIEFGGATREVVGVGNKDGTYYVLDRDGVNEVTGLVEPYWSTQVVPGGDIGGILATAAVDEVDRRVHFSTAAGDRATNLPPLPPQMPTLHALDLDTGAVVWDNGPGPGLLASFAPTSAITGVAFFGTVPGTTLRAHRTIGDDGSLLASFTFGAIALASAPVAIDGTLLVGGGIGPGATATIPGKLTALCVPGTRACATDVPVAGRRLALKDAPGVPVRRSLRLGARDPAVVLDPGGGPGDPTLVGATLQILNPVSGEGQEIRLPAARWSPANGGYRYRDRDRESGPCTTVVLRPNAIRVRCKGDGLTMTLDEPQQGALAAALHVGTDVTYCARFGGTVKRDAGSGAGSPGRFTATAAPAPVACPLP